MLALLALACAGVPEGLRLTPDGTGPVVRVDWDAEPLPDIPFPNDLATVADPRSPTGLRPNLPLDADVEQENRGRAALDELSGFGVFAPITVAFDAPLDVQHIVDRQPDDYSDPDAVADDVAFVVDVDPDSPEQGRVIPLDWAHGRYTQDLTQAEPILPNDPRAGEPSTLFETAEEDANGNGELDPGEDSDGDDILDHPNVWPPGGDHRLDLLTFYDLQSHTLRLRPILPLREETRYAVVLTEDLRGEDGEPVRSPWTWVNHTAQTDALRPVIGALEAHGRGLDDVAFAWTFTTGRVTRDLWDVVEGMRGNGPFAWLADAYPAGVTEGHELHDATVPGDPLSLPVDALLTPLVSLGALYAPTDYIGEAYDAWASAIVGGAIVAPNLLADKDDGGLDDSDERWELDANTGTLFAEPGRAVFTCILPKAGDGVEPPWDVAIHSHGYGSLRLELVAFAYAELRHGIAVCGLDAPGQGIELDAELTASLGSLLANGGTGGAWYHVLDDRDRDLDNDGEADPASDMFTADAFHTRDMLRQAVVDQAQLIRSLRACGTGTMERVVPGPLGPTYTGERVVSCDWDGDGEPDIGGPGTKFYLEGVSQGGIVTSVAIAVNDAQTAVATVPGGGLADVGARTDIGGVQTAMIGRAMSPAIIGLPDAYGLQIAQVVVSLDSSATLPVDHLDAWAPGDEVVVRNLALGTESRGWIQADGRFFVPIGANALDAAGKRMATGMPEPPDPTAVYSVADNAELGDPLVVEIRDASGGVRATIDAWAAPVVFEGVTMDAGSRLVAAAWGLGLRRGSADLQRTVGALAIGVEGADPIVYARRWDAEPFAEPKNVLVHLTVGDTTVPEATGIALARADGLVPFDEVDPRYGETVDRWLVDRGVTRGLEETGPWRGAYGDAILFDPDDLDDGTDGTGAPSDEPLRATRQSAAGGVHGLRFLYVDPHGTHAYILPEEGSGFDWAMFGAQQMAEFLSSDGTDLSDDPCLATRDCPFLRPLPEVP